MKVKDIESLLKKEGYSCVLCGDGDVEIEGFSDPSSYRAGTVIWLGDMKYLSLREEQTVQDVALLMCRDTLEGREQFPNVLICEDPRNAFVRLMELAQCEKREEGIHPSATIDAGAIIGEHVYIGPNCVIGKDVVIGDNCSIMPGSYVEHTEMGDNCEIYPNCVIGTAAFGFRKDDGLVMEPHLGRVILGNNVDVLSGSVIERGTTKDTVIGDGTKLACLANVGHNVTIGRDCQIIGGIINGFAEVGDNSELIRCVVANRKKIGKNVKIGLNSTVVKDIPDDVVAFGSPARIKRGGASTNI